MERLLTAARVVGLIFLSSGLLAACGQTQSAASPTPTPSPTPVPVVEAKVVGTQGNILVAKSNGMTLYTFTRDTAFSGKSACSGGCLARWPALTVTAGQKVTGGPGVTGLLGTITREDNAALQVTHNGLPLHFFSMDVNPGDTKGIYPLWAVVKP